MLGHERHFHFRINGPAFAQGNDFMVPGFLLDGWAVAAQPTEASKERKVLLRLRSKDGYAVGQYSETSRVFLLLFEMRNSGSLTPHTGHQSSQVW